MAARDRFPWIWHLACTAETNTRNEAGRILTEVDVLTELVEFYQGENDRLREDFDDELRNREAHL
jgi:hypothetical protein